MIIKFSGGYLYIVVALGVAFWISKKEILVYLYLVCEFIAIIAVLSCAFCLQMLHFACKTRISFTNRAFEFTNLHFTYKCCILFFKCCISFYY